MGRVKHKHTGVFLEAGLRGEISAQRRERTRTRVVSLGRRIVVNFKFYAEAERLLERRRLKELFLYLTVRESLKPTEASPCTIAYGQATLSPISASTQFPSERYP